MKKPQWSLRDVWLRPLHTEGGSWNARDIDFAQTLRDPLSGLMIWWDVVFVIWWAVVRL